MDSLPENTGFPWNDMISLTNEGSRGVGLALSAIHDQLCVVADLLCILIQESRSKEAE